MNRSVPNGEVTDNRTRDAVWSRYQEACRSYDRWTWLSLACWLPGIVVSAPLLLRHVPRTHLAWSIGFGIWYLLLSACLVRHGSYWVAMRRYRLALARLHGERIGLTTAFRFAPEEHRDIYNDDPIQYAQDAFCRVVPLSIIAWAALTVVAVQNVVQGQRPF